MHKLKNNKTSLIFRDLIRKPSHNPANKLRDKSFFGYERKNDVFRK